MEIYYYFFKEMYLLLIRKFKKDGKLLATFFGKNKVFTKKAIITICDIYKLFTMETKFLNGKCIP